MANIYEKQKKIDRIYDQFIEYLKKEETKLDLNAKDLEKHHILPLHDGGQKNGSVVLCSRQNHTLAHYYRFLTYGQRGDKICFQMRQGRQISSADMALLAVQTLKRKKIGFYNSEWQSIQGKKPKKKPKTQNQMLQCQKLGHSRKKKILCELLKRKAIWKYEDKQSSLFKTIDPQASLTNTIQILDETLKSQNKKTLFSVDTSGFYKVIKGQRKSYHGWSLFFVYFYYFVKKICS